MSAYKTFLLVEDDPFDASFVRHEFEAAAANTILRLARDGAEAQSYVRGEASYADRTQYPVPDVILLDLRMPRVDGFEFLQWLRMHAPVSDRQIPVVALICSKVHETIIEEVYKRGANAHLFKPLTWENLRTELQTLGGDRPNIRAGRTTFADG